MQLRNKVIAKVRPVTYKNVINSRSAKNYVYRMFHTSENNQFNDC